MEQQGKRRHLTGCSFHLREKTLMNKITVPLSSCDLEINKNEILQIDEGNDSSSDNYSSEFPVSDDDARFKSCNMHVIHIAIS